MDKNTNEWFLKKIKSFAIIILIIVCVILYSWSASGAYEEKKSEEVELPIIMYHSLLKNTKLQNDFVISPDIFEADLKFFKENGYSTVTVNDIIDYTYNEKDLPEKCVMLTFDDGYYNNYEYAFPLLEKYDAKIVISPIAKMSEMFTETQDISVTYGHISVDNIKEMIASDRVEIQNHSYDMHRLTPRKGIGKKSGESEEDYKEKLMEDISLAHNYLKENSGVSPNCFVYPFGEESKSTLNIIKEFGYKCTLTCTEKNNIISKDKESLYELGRFRRDSKENIETLMARIEKSNC